MASSSAGSSRSRKGIDRNGCLYSLYDILLFPVGLIVATLISAYGWNLISGGWDRISGGSENGVETPASSVSSDYGSTVETVWVKYREPDPWVPVGSPRFLELSSQLGSSVRDAWYDPAFQYMVIELGGTAYHYCAFPSGQWADLNRSNDRYRHYEINIRGKYDCRYVGTVPDYP